MIEGLGRVLGLFVVAYGLLLLVLWCWFDIHHPIVKRMAVGVEVLLMMAFLLVEFTYL